VRQYFQRAAVSVVVALIVGSVALRTLFPGRAFNPVAWRDEALVEQGVRLSMADRLVARDALLGKTRSEVVKLLGEPTVPGGAVGVWDLEYLLGLHRGFPGIGYECLVMRLGADGRVCECRIVHD
jgi:hypothetical protein